MGGFATRVFTLLLSWMRSVASFLWGLFSTGSGGDTGWLASHWKGLALGLCVAGLVLDAVVYLVRWRPDRVWASFFRRLRQKRTAPRRHTLPQEESEAEVWADQPLPPEAAFAGQLADETEMPSAEAEMPSGRRRRSAQTKGLTLRDRLQLLYSRITAEEQQRPSLRKPLAAQDKQETFHAPYVPEQWRKPSDTGTNRRRRRRAADGVISEDRT